MVIPFTYNHKFKVQKGSEFFIKGDLQFPEEPLLRRPKGQVRRDGTYRTAFGPNILHDGSIYTDSNHNVSRAFRRLTCVRECDWVLENLLSTNQLCYVNASTTFLELLRAHLAPAFDDYIDSVDYARDHHADSHLKKQLRIQAWEELLETGDVATPLWLRYVTYKMKKNEWAKPLKYARMIGDLGVAASLQGFGITKYMKQGMAKPFHYKGGIIFFCSKPDQDLLTYVFSELVAPSGTYFFVCFSDDACYSVRTPDGVKTFNLDISKCDASHGPAIFDAFKRLAGPRLQDDLQKLVTQCETPIRIYDKDTRRNFVQLRPRVPVLYSGSTITTSINNLANFLIASSIVDNRASDPKSLIAAARLVGYILTITECPRVEDIQFLKYSPVLDVNGVWRPVLNPGVLLRLSGVCNGDLPGRGPLQPRAVAFQKALLQGAYPRTKWPLIDNMKEQVSLARDDYFELSQEVLRPRLEYKVGNWEETHSFHSADVYRRYNLTSSEMDELDNCFGRAQFGEQFTSSGASKILKLDYGLSCKVRW